MHPSPLTTSSNRPYEIRPVRTSSEQEAVERLRYEVYVAEMGRPQPDADHERRRIGDALDIPGLVLGAFRPDGRAVGTIRQNDMLDVGASEREFYGFEELANPRGRTLLASKLILDPLLRGSILACELSGRLYREGLLLGAEYYLIDANDHLVPFYSRLGFRPTARKHHPLYGDVTVMQLNCLDGTWLRQVRSPFLRSLRAFQSSSLAAA